MLNEIQDNEKIYGAETLEIQNKTYHITKVFKDISCARAMVKDDNIIIKFPIHYNKEQIKKSYENLKVRIIKAINKNPNRFVIKKIKFFNNEWIEDVFKHKHFIMIEDEKSNNLKRIKATSDNQMILIRLPSRLNETEKDYYITKIVTKILSKQLLPDLKKRIEFLNDTYFSSKINKIIIRNNSSNWGTYNRKTNNIGINFKLLFVPLPILDSVIIHELAHIKVHNHSKEFWEIIYSIIPDYKERKKWLNKNRNNILEYNKNGIEQNPLLQQ